MAGFYAFNVSMNINSELYDGIIIIIILIYVCNQKYDINQLQF